jgi:hypothetical protein
MSRSMTRRAFTAAVAALGAGAIAIPTVAANGQRYALRLRHHREKAAQGTKVALWVRVINKTNFSSSVPVTFRVATDSALQGVVWQATGVASQTSSHIARASTLLTSQQVPDGVPLYAGVLLGDPPALAKARRIRRKLPAVA